MVRALLAGTKTQTRRVVKPWEPRLMNLRRPVPDDVSYLPDFTCYRSTCPYGAPGDRLWVRETWMDLQGTGVEVRTGDRSRYAFAADTPPGSYGDEQRKSYGLKWKPSIHMPRAACRLVLEITGVRVERLMAISEEDARAEGIDLDPGEGGVFWVRGLGFGCAADTAAGSFCRLWESINGDGSWTANPWVWVVEFRRLETAR